MWCHTKKTKTHTHAHTPQDSTFALTLFRKNTTLDGSPIKVDFWDTAGQERFNSLHPSYYYQSHICILVFDVTRKQTYTQLKEWYRELREYCPSIPCILLANKIDVDYQVTKKKEKEKFVFEKENYSLKHENEILKRRVEALEKVLEIKSNDSVSIATSESEDEKELEKEEVSLD